MRAFASRLSNDASEMDVEDVRRTGAGGERGWLRGMPPPAADADGHNSADAGDVEPSQVWDGLLYIIDLADRVHVVPVHGVHAYDSILEWTASSYSGA